ncbi:MULTISPECIES: aminotransferase class IV [unclassified Thermoactinomyces]|uniref:aminotransferase class IV n=1 Tax=unclassified Thermoactinomyces TaxID=2634588 RepID=UPI001E5A4271|nr:MULTISPECIES: aminotransferase class IV [unclassified Thermoactinomyces]
MGTIMMNGRLVREEEAVVSVFDHGLLYGVGAFETMRLYDGHLFLFADHLERLEAGLKRMAIKSPHSPDEWRGQIDTLIRETGYTSGVVRLMVTGGNAGAGLGSGYDQPNSFVWLRPLPFSPGEPFNRGRKMKTVSVPRQAIGGAEPYKTNNYLNSILARQELGQLSDTEGLMLTPDGYVAEGIVSNLFFVKNGVLYTPSLDLGILNGVTRRFILRLAALLGIPVKEGAFSPSFLYDSDEIFIANSLLEIVPVTEWEGREWFQFPLTKRLIEAYHQYVTWLTDSDELRGKGETNDESSD